MGILSCLHLGKAGKGNFALATDSQEFACRSQLIEAGRVCTVRDSRGDDEMAACGQLGVGKDRLAPMLRVPPQFEAALAPPEYA